MQQQGETVLQLENLQPSTSLPPGRVRLLYFLLTRLILGGYIAVLMQSDSPGAALRTLLTVTVPLAIVDYRLSRRPRGEAGTKRDAFRYFGELAGLVAVVTALIWVAGRVFGTAEELNPLFVAAAIGANAVFFGIPLWIILATRRRRLAAGVDVRTVENIGLRPVRFAVLTLLVCAAPAFPGQRVAAAALSPDGRRVLVTAFDDNALSVFDVAARRATKTGLEGRAELADDGRLAALLESRDADIPVIDAATLQVLRTLSLPAAHGEITGVELGKGGDRAIVRALDRSWLYDGHGTVIANLPQVARFASDGRHVLHRDKELSILDENAKRVLSLPLPSDSDIALDVDPTGTWAAVLQGAGCLRRIELSPPNAERALQGPFCRAGESARGLLLSFAPRGDRILVQVDSAVALLDADGALVKTLFEKGKGPAPPIHLTVTMGDGSRSGPRELTLTAQGTAVMALVGGRAHLFRIEDGAPLLELPIELPAPWTRGGAELSADRTVALTWSDGLDGTPLAILLGTMGLLLALGTSLRAGVTRLKSRPNQGMHLTARMVVLVTVVISAIAATLLVSGLRLLRTTHVEGLILVGIVLGVGFGLGYGGLDLAYHFILRAFLARRRELPFRAARFLDGAAQQIFLRKVGGGYIFIHRLVLEYFARDAEKRLL
jgi:hypothetical protein